MGVYIKGMEMPCGCAGCPFSSSPVYDCRGYAKFFCEVDVEEIRGKDVTGNVLATYDGDRESFANWCPLIEVPDHGRLIDADSICMPYDICDGDEAMEFIKEAPTVIPADVTDTNVGKKEET